MKNISLIKSIKSGGIDKVAIDKKTKVGIIGAGFVTTFHIDALRRLGFVDIVALCDTNREAAEKKAREFCVPRVYTSYEDLIGDPDIQVIHNCAPNNLHFEINAKAINQGKHVFSEKPLGMNRQEAHQMLELAKKHGIVHGVNFNYRMYPLVQDMKRRVLNGEIGEVRLVYGSYLQDWLFYDTDYNWRIEVEIGGETRAVGDIGSHWCDLLQTITGLKIVKVFADFATVIPVRKKSKTVETFTKVKGMTSYEERKVYNEDWAVVILQLENGAKGVFYVSQVSAGRKCYLNIEIAGSEKTFYWNQEAGDQMWVGYRDQPNCIIIRDPEYLSEGAKQYAVSPGGHPEGWLDTFRNNIRAFYTFLIEGKNIEIEKPDFATFYDGYDIACIVDAIVESAKTGRWVEIKREPLFDSIY